MNNQNLDGLNDIDCEILHTNQLYLNGVLLSNGSTGYTGNTGSTGRTGNTGPTGPIGPQGLQGVKGNDGNKGNDGDTGPQGEKGDNGTNGADGDSSAATTAAVLAASSAGVAAAAAASSVSAAASSVSSASSATSASVCQQLYEEIAPKVIYQTAGTTDISGSTYTRFTSNVRINNGLTNNIVLYKNGNIDKEGNLNTQIIDASVLNIKSNSLISFTGSDFQFNEDRLKFSTGFNVLYNELLYCSGLTGNIQNQLDIISKGTGPTGNTGSTGITGSTGSTGPMLP